MSHSYSGREVDEIVQRRCEEYRRAALLGWAFAALSAALLGAVVGAVLALLVTR